MNMRQAMPHGIDKKNIATSFGRAALSYDRHATLQRQVADRLVGMTTAQAPARILDLGSGTGYCTGLLRQRYPGAEIINLDLSPAMLAHARQHGPAGVGSYICADAESLPLRADSVDLVVSGLAIQWCRRYARLFADLRRILRPGAQCCMSTFGPLTLGELKAAWAAVDSHVHVNEFCSRERLEHSLRPTGFGAWEIHEELRVRHYAGLDVLGRELKAIGAHNMNRGQARGLMGKQRLARLRQAFQRGEQQGLGVPVSWQVYYLDLRA